MKGDDEILLTYGETRVGGALDVVCTILDKASDRAGLFLTELSDRLNAGVALDAIMDEFVTLWENDITWIDRFTPETRAELVENHLLNVDDGRPVAVVIYPKADYNGAFRNNQIEELIAQGYRLMYYEAETEDQAYRALYDGTSTRKASVLVLGGHGCRFGASMGSARTATARATASITHAEIVANPDVEERTLDVSDEREMLALALTDCLVSNVTDDEIDQRPAIILESCSTGFGKDRVENFANVLGRVFPRSVIFSPTQDASVVEYVFDAAGWIVDVHYDCGEANTYVIGKS